MLHIHYRCDQHSGNEQYERSLACLAHCRICQNRRQNDRCSFVTYEGVSTDCEINSVRCGSIYTRISLHTSWNSMHLQDLGNTLRGKSSRGRPNGTHCIVRWDGFESDICVPAVASPHIRNVCGTSNPPNASRSAAFTLMPANHAPHRRDNRRVCTKLGRVLRDGMLV